VTRDGVDAENPVATPDRAWIVYASVNPASRGIMKIRPNGTDAALVVPGNLILPEVSPDGRHVAFVADAGTERSAPRVARLVDGMDAGFAVRLPPWVAGGTIDQGRCRWLPDGRALAYIAAEPDGGYAVFVQPFTPGVETSDRRRRVAGFEPGLDAESLGISAHGRFLTVSFREQLFDLMLVEDVPGLEP
jgi:Tol biopolymer transport system component